MNERRPIIKSSLSFKQEVVREIEEEGLSHLEASRRYGIKGSMTIKKWIIKFGKDHLVNKVIRIEMKGEVNQQKRLEAELRRLKEAYADLSLKHQCAEKVIELANEELKMDLKKSFGTDASSNSKGNSQ
ncbi:Transposase and inactivated derivatives, partial [Dyadobacter soli]